jgi:hypothetical protein
MHRIRLAMQQGTFEKLSGTVEVDETFIGGKAKNMHAAKRKVKITGRGAAGRIIVMGLIARKTEARPSTVRAKIVKNRQQGRHIRRYGRTSNLAPSCLRIPPPLTSGWTPSTCAEP